MRYLSLIGQYSDYVIICFLIPKIARLDSNFRLLLSTLPKQAGTIWPNDDNRSHGKLHLVYIVTMLECPNQAGWSEALVSAPRLVHQTPEHPMVSSQLGASRLRRDVMSSYLCSLMANRCSPAHVSTQLTGPNATTAVVKG